MAHFIVSMPHQDFEFDGRRVAGPVDNRKGDSGRLRSRWLELKLFRTDGGMYVVVRTAHSMVVHEQDAPCVVEGKASERGTVMPAGVVPPGAIPCNEAEPLGRRRCYPDLSSGLVRIEQPRVTTYRSTAPADVIRWLSEANHRDGGTSDMMSRPVAALLEQARRKDRAFRIHPVVRIA